MNAHRNDPNAAASRWQGIKRNVALLALALAMGATATAAQAADGCFKDDVGDILVFKKLKVPKPGDCQPINGHQNGSYCTLDGTACGTSDGLNVRYKFEYICSSFETGTYTFNIERRYNYGIGSSCWTHPTSGQRVCSNNMTVSKVACPANKVVP